MGGDRRGLDGWDYGGVVDGWDYGRRLDKWGDNRGLYR